jgi:RNA polymerase sigma-70 factor (ECF subfamily)
MAATQTLEWVQTIPPAGDFGAPGQERCRKRPARGIRRPRSLDTRRALRKGNEDWKFVQRAIAGDSDALATLFAPERERLYRAAFSVVRNKEDAEDALQSGLFSAYTKLRSFQGRSRFSTWLTRIVLNAALMSRRKVQSAPHISLDEQIADSPEQWTTRLVDREPNPEQVYVGVETKNLLKRELRDLSPALQSAFQLRFLEHMSSGEAAKAQKINISAFKSRAMRARRQVVKQLTSKGVVSWRDQFISKDRSCLAG